MPEKELINLYSKRILALAGAIPLTGKIKDPLGVAYMRTPICGSTITVEIDIEGEKVTRFGQEIKACALGQASAAILGNVIIGRCYSQLETARDNLAAMLKNNAPPPGAPFDGYEVLIPAQNYPNRHDSIMLALNATLCAFDKAKTAANADEIKQ